MNRILVTNVDHNGILFGGEFGGQSGVFQQDAGVTTMNLFCTSATFSNGWASCYSFTEGVE